MVSSSHSSASWGVKSSAYGSSSDEISPSMAASHSRESLNSSMCMREMASTAELNTSAVPAASPATARLPPLALLGLEIRGSPPRGGA